MLQQIYFLNGPNANLYGMDKNGTYGVESFASIAERCQRRAQSQGITLQFRQSNHEGVLVDWIQEARQQADGLIINAAGLSYSSVPILDALLMLDRPIIEVHMSNIWQREPFRHHSMVSKASTGVIAGLGVLGYELAIDALVTLLGTAGR